MAAGKSGPIAETTRLKVVSPLGEATVEETAMAPRPDTLDGKTICLIWNGAFKSNITLSVIAGLLREKFPTARVISYTEMPKSSKAPAPGTTDPEKTALLAAFRENHCDAVISGNGG